MQSELSECQDKERRREVQERLKEYDEVSINVLCVDLYLPLFIPFPCMLTPMRLNKEVFLRLGDWLGLPFF